jgi:hypothetical protein
VQDRILDAADSGSRPAASDTALPHQTQHPLSRTAEEVH